CEARACPPRTPRRRTCRRGRSASLPRSSAWRCPRPVLRTSARPSCRRRARRVPRTPASAREPRRPSSLSSGACDLHHRGRKRVPPVLSRKETSRDYRILLRDGDAVRRYNAGAMEAPMDSLSPNAGSSLTDEEIVAMVRAGHVALFEVLMRRYNQRLYRIARSILHGHEEVEDVMQETYLRAYAHLGQFAGRARFSTWLTRIAVHEAATRARRAPPPAGIPLVYEVEIPGADDTPEQEVLRGEAQVLLDRAIEALPRDERAVFILREVEELDTAETAAVLAVSQEA